MKCPVCDYSFSFGEFCKIANPAKILCPRCQSKLKIVGIRILVALVTLAAIVYLIPATMVSDLFREPFNYAVLVAFSLAFLYAAGYLVYRYCELEKVDDKERTRQA